MKARMSRRAFLSGAAALGVAAYADMAAAAAESNPGRVAFKLPARGEFIIRGGYVMTMDPTLGDIASGDVHVKNGAIVAVGAGLKASGGAQVLDGRDIIVLPGFVDTHWHMWNTLLRSMSGDKPGAGYFHVSTTLGRVFTPDDLYQGTRLACAEAVYSGITSAHDWCHNIRMVSTQALNLAVCTDPAHMLVTAAQPANVDTVIVDGRVLKRNGALTALDPLQVGRDARDALAGVRARAGWP